MLLQKKYAHQSRLSNISIDVLNAKYEEYRNLLKENCDNPDDLAEILENYLASCKETEIAMSMTTQCGYYFSIMEEHPVLIFEDFVEKHIEDLREIPSNIEHFVLGSCNCVVSVACTIDFARHEETKDIDFCLACKTDQFNHAVPLFGYEVKRYFDKTMYKDAVSVYEFLSRFRPTTVYGIVAEDDARSNNGIARMVGKEFILTGCSRPKSTDHGIRNSIDKTQYKKWFRATQMGLRLAIYNLEK